MSDDADPDLDALRSLLGTISNIDNANLGRVLDGAKAWVRERVQERCVQDAEVRLATLLLAARWYKRRMTPEGTGGWIDSGTVASFSTDPDIDRLLEHKLDMTRAGVA